MNINTSIFKAYDIRGLYPQDVNAENTAVIVKGVYTFYKRLIGKSRLIVVLGRDMRISSPELYAVAEKTLVALGADVRAIGLAATTSVYFAATHLKADICIQITASHNPKDYNGVKFCRRVGSALEKPSGAYSVADIRDLVLSGEFEPEMAGGTLTDVKDIVKIEARHFFSQLPVKPSKKYRIVADPGNAMGATYIKALTEIVDIDLVEMNFELDGTFPAHQADPSQSVTLVSLQKRVVSEHADFGVATDGDGDRIVFIDEHGAIIPTSHMASLIAREILIDKPGAKIIGNVQKIYNIKRNVERFGGSFDQIRVGHTFITNRLNKEPIEFCGEISGHYFFKSNGGAESSILVFLYILKALDESGKSISALLAEFKQAEEMEETNFVVANKEVVATILAELESKYADATIEKIDGTTVDAGTWRVNIRTSNTEPLLRLNTEGDDAKIVHAKFDEMKAMIERHGGKLKSGH